MLEAKAMDQRHKCKYFPKKKGLKTFFRRSPKKKNGLEKHFSADLQNFNYSKNSAVLEPRTEQFLRPRPRTWKYVLEDVFQAKDVLEDSTSGVQMACTIAHLHYLAYEDAFDHFLAFCSIDFWEHEISRL